jgi:hypothetical protein
LPQVTAAQELQIKAEARLASLMEEKLVNRISVLSTLLGGGKTTELLLVRILVETLRYMKLTQMASFTAKIILDTISQWHPASNPQKSGASEVTAASVENNMGPFEKSHLLSQRDTSELILTCASPCLH